MTVKIYRLLSVCCQRRSYLLWLLSDCSTSQHWRSCVQHWWLVHSECVHHGQGSQSEAGSGGRRQVGPQWSLSTLVLEMWIWQMSWECQKLYQKSGKNLVEENCLLLSSHLGLYECLLASFVQVYYTVKYDVGNRNLSESAAKWWKCRGISQCLRVVTISVSYLRCLWFFVLSCYTAYVLYYCNTVGCSLVGTWWHNFHPVQPGGTWWDQVEA